jgi:hypothetical protein
MHQKVHEHLNELVSTLNWRISLDIFPSLSVVVVFELRTLHLLGRCSTAWVISLVLFNSGCFRDRKDLTFCSNLPGPRSSYSPPPLSWSDRCSSPHPTIGWDGGGLTNFLPRWASNHDLPDLSIPSSQDYTQLALTSLRSTNWAS